MHRFNLRPLILIGIAALAACVSVQSGDKPMIVNLRSEGGTCSVRVVSNAYVQPLNFTRVSQEQLLQLAREATSRRAIVVADVTTQYECLGGAIITLQQAGMAVDFAIWDNR